MYGSGNSDKQCCIITCLLFSVVWVIVGISLLLVGLFAPPLYTEGTSEYEESKHNIENCKVGGLVLIPLSAFWCFAMCFWFCKDSADFKRLQAERIEQVNKEYARDAALVAAANGAISNSNVHQTILVTPVAVPVPVNVGHFCRKCGTVRVGYHDTFCVKCGASLTEGVPTGPSHTPNRSWGNAANNNNNISSITYPSNQSYIGPDNNVVVNVSVVPNPVSALAPPSAAGGKRHSPRNSANGMPSQPPSFYDVSQPSNPYGVASSDYNTR